MVRWAKEGTKLNGKGGKSVNEAGRKFDTRGARQIFPDWPAGRKFDTRGARQIFPDWPREVPTGNNVAVQVIFKCACVGFVLRSL